MKKHISINERSDRNQLIRAAYDLAHAAVFGLVFAGVFFLFVFRLYTVDAVSVLSQPQGRINMDSLVVYENTDSTLSVMRVLAGSNQTVYIDTQNKKILVDNQKIADYDVSDMIQTLPNEPLTLSDQYLAAKLSTTGKHWEATEYLIVDKNQVEGVVRALILPVEEFRIF